MALPEIQQGSGRASCQNCRQTIKKDEACLAIKDEFCNKVVKKYICGNCVNAFSSVIKIAQKTAECV